MKKLIVTIALLAVAICQLYSQNSLSLIVDGILPTNVYYNNSYDIYARLHNDDSTVVFEDTIDFNVSNLQGIIPQANSIFSKPAYSGKKIMLNPLESVPAYFRITIDPGVFRTKGQDVVIIWPIIKNMTPLFNIRDSLVWNVNVDYPAGIGELNLDENDFWLKNNQLYFPKNNPKQVRIFSINGSKVYEQSETPQSQILTTTNWENGLYIIQWIDTYNNYRQTKIIKMD